MEDIYGDRIIECILNVMNKLQTEGNEAAYDELSNQNHYHSGAAYAIILATIKYFSEYGENFFTFARESDDMKFNPAKSLQDKILNAAKGITERPNDNANERIVN